MSPLESCAPAAFLIAITCVGRSSMAEALSAMNIHMSSDALGLSRFASFSSFIASSPNGVAALPSPRKLAARLSVMGATAAGDDGKRRLSTGLNPRDKAPTRPHSPATSMSPMKNIYDPMSDIDSMTASPAPLSILSVSSSVRPVAMPVTIPATIIIIHSTFMTTPPIRCMRIR